MADITELAQREKFEAWARSQKLGLSYGDCGYVFSSTEMAWRAWMTSSAELVEALEKAQQVPVMPLGLHPDTQKLVTDFCTALAEKLYKAQLKYGYDADWKQDGWTSQCQTHFHQHIAKGDPRDVAAYCAFMWWHGWKTKVAQPAPEYPETLPCPVLLEPGLRFGKGIKTSSVLAALARRAVYESDMAALSQEERAEFQARIEDFKALIAQPVPVVPQDVLEALQKVARIRLDLNDFDGDRRGIADCLCDAEEALIEVVNRRAATLAAATQEVK